jgi:tetratricopeptide (TPR) repeat protein
MDRHHLLVLSAMDERALIQLKSRAQSHLAHGSNAAAIEILRQALTFEPDDADAHALLALALHGARRLTAARLEAGRAITADPESSLAHLASATVHYSARDWEAARSHARTAAAGAPDDAITLSLVADLFRAMGDLDAADEPLAHALELAPDDPSVRAIAGWAARARRDTALAWAHAKAALVADPSHGSALVLRGQLHLDEGHTEAAREHALWALRESPNDPRALALLVSVKARSSLALGLWWRFNSVLIAGGRNRAVAWLVGVFLFKRLIELTLGDFGYRSTASAITWLWFAFCVYTWLGPAMFQRALRRELDDVQLRGDF